MIFVYRDFASYDKDGNVTGCLLDMRMRFYNNGYLLLQILNSNDEEDNYQKMIYIKYTEKIDLYNVIILILDKVSYDIFYKYYERDYKIHKDFIINDNKNLDDKIWNLDYNKNNYGGEWIDLTRENIKYITFNENDYVKDINKNYIIGELNDYGNLIY